MMLPTNSMRFARLRVRVGRMVFLIWQKVLPIAKFVYLTPAIILIVLRLFDIGFLSALPGLLLVGLIGVAALLVIFAIYRTEKLQYDLIGVMPVVTLILINDYLITILNSIMVIAILLWFVINKTKPLMRDFVLVFYSVLLIICIISVGLHFILQDLVQDTTLAEARSPDGRHRIRLIAHDQGALGGGTFIMLDRTFWGMFKPVRYLYQGEWGQEPQARWLDTEHVAIDGHVLDIHVSPAIRNYRGQSAIGDQEYHPGIGRDNKGVKPKGP